MQHLVTRLRASLLAATLAIGLAATGSAQFSITTTYAAGNGQSGNMFDVAPVGGGVIINSFDVHLAGSATVEVWAITGGGSYVGNENSATNWTMLATTAVTGAGTGVGTPLNLSLGHVIPPGTTQGFYVTTTAGTLSYTNGTTVGALYVTDGFLNVYEGVGVGYAFGAGGIYTPRIWNGTIHYGLLSSVADDLAVTDITAPVGQSFTCTPLSNAETVTIEMRNWGMNPVPAGTTLLVSYQIDNNPPTIEAILLANPLTIGQLLSYTFLAAGDFSVPGPHALTANVAYAADLDPSNDTLVETVDSGAAQQSFYPFVEDLNGLVPGTSAAPPGWGQDPADGSADWEFSANGTPTPNTGPATDVSGGGIFAYVSDATEETAVNIRTPCFDLSPLVAPRLAFYMHSFNNSAPFTNDALLSVDVISLSTGTTMTDALGPIGHQGPNWTYQSLDLSPWAGDVVQLVFRVDTSNGQISHDIAIDDVAVFDPVATPGQAPQSGLAILDINQARNGNLQGTYVLGNGPYYTSVQAGDVLAFGFEGEPGMPIVLLAGPLNPVAASFPNVGQFDIGGPVDPMTGIPTSLLILADGGNGMGLNAFFVLGAGGRTDLGFGVPALPTGVLGTFQAAVFTSGGNGAPVALTNAVQVSLN